MITRISFVLLGAMLALNSPAAAFPITVAFEGTVTSVEDGLEGTFAIGQPVSGRYTFDSETPDLDPLPGTGVYLIDAYDFNIGPYVGSLPEPCGTILVANNPEGVGLSDIYRASAITCTLDEIQGADIGSFTPLYFSLQLTLLANAFDSDALVLTPPDLSPFSVWQGFLLAFVDQMDPDDPFDNVLRSVNTNLTSLTLVPSEIPEPATLALFGLGLAGLGVVRRRRLG